MNTPDPYGQFHSSYVGMGNNPVSGTDPTGGIYKNYGQGQAVSEQISKAMYLNSQIGFGFIDPWTIENFRYFFEGASITMGYDFFSIISRVGRSSSGGGTTGNSTLFLIAEGLEGGYAVGREEAQIIEAIGKSSIGRNYQLRGAEYKSGKGYGYYVQGIYDAGGKYFYNPYKSSQTHTFKKGEGGTVAFFVPFSSGSVSLAKGGYAQGSGGDGSNWVSNLRTAAGLTVDWVLGVGSDNYIFVNSPAANAMRNSPGIVQARNDYYNSGKTSGRYDFGIKGLMNAGIDPIEQFVGSYKYNISVAGNNLQFTLTNITSFSSAAYHLWPYSWNWNSGPMGNTTQTYIFTEPLLQIKK